jgi:hypothetical protein
MLANLSAFGGKADVHGRVALTASAVNDPLEDNARIEISQGNVQRFRLTSVSAR